jgi:hypothetical protein
LHELKRGRQILERERCNTASIQDPPALTGRRTYGQGGIRQRTAAELADDELRRNDRGYTNISAIANGTIFASFV